MPASESTDRLSCPKCKAAMESVTVNDITVDRCTSCHGIWFDLMEHQHLRETAGAESIDVGPPSKGEDLQSKKKMTCPRCKAQMTRLRDTDKREIVYEYCSVCNGAFFDAGEFTQYAHPSFVVKIRSWFKREK